MTKWFLTWVNPDNGATVFFLGGFAFGRAMERVSLGGFRQVLFRENLDMLFSYRWSM